MSHLLQIIALKLKTMLSNIIKLNQSKLPNAVLITSLPWVKLYIASLLPDTLNSQGSIHNPPFLFVHQTNIDQVSAMGKVLSKRGRGYKDEWNTFPFFDVLTSVVGEAEI